MYYRAVVRRDPNDANAHNNLGAVLCDKKRDFDGAVACFEEAIRLEPKEAIYRENLGWALVS